MFKIKRKILITLLLITGIIIFVGCQKNRTGLNPQKGTNELVFKLGKKLKNPYSVANMKKAYANLTNNLKSGISIHTTHYYVKFKPKNEKELNILKQDTTLELYDYPLDYEVIEGQDVYHDPSIPDSLPTYQYCAVPVNYNFPNVDYDILEDLYIPEELETLKSKNYFVDALVEEALRITGNLDEDGQKSSLKSIQRRRRWTPAGRILVWDDIGASGNIINYLNISNPHKIPIEKVKVRARRWFTTHIGYTNEQGYFRCNGSFKRPANYSIDWETSKFDIRDGTFGQAYFNGPKIQGDWNLEINSGKSLRFATIFRAACRYQYYNIGGLKRPNVWSKIKYSYYHRNQKNNEYSGINLGNWDFTGTLPNINLFGQVNYEWVKTNELYSTTIHETAHASHIELMNGGEIQFSQVSNFIRESWADAVEWYITKIEYNWLGNSGYDNPFDSNNNPYRFVDNKQNWSISFIQNQAPVYTPIFIDLVDNFNQRSEYYNGYLYPNDVINSYTMHNIEQLLKHVYGLSSLKNALKSNKPSGVTDNDIDTNLSIY